MKLTDLTLDDLDAMADCAGRETAMRRSVYPRLVADEKMTPEKADAELRTMEAIASLLRHLRDEKAGVRELF